MSLKTKKLDQGATEMFFFRIRERGKSFECNIRNIQKPRYDKSKF